MDELFFHSFFSSVGPQKGREILGGTKQSLNGFLYYCNWSVSLEGSVMTGKEEFERGMENHQKLLSLDQQLRDMEKNSSQKLIPLIYGFGYG